MRRLNLRIATLAALVALFATSVSALAGVHSVRRSLREQQEGAALSCLEEVHIQLRQLEETLAFEVRDYAVWDELYEQMPKPSPSWAEINLRPGKDTGRVCQVFILAAEGQVIGRYHSGDQRWLGPASGDPAPTASLLPLVERALGSGIAVLDGLPVLWSAHPITRSDGTGRPRGVMLGLAYFNQRVVARFHLNGWVASFAPDAKTGGDPQVVFSGNSVSANGIEPALGGGLRITVSEKDSQTAAVAFRANNAIAIAGMITAVVATLAGIALGFHWVRPIHQLAEACRRRAHEPGHALPIDQTLTEAAVMGSALQALIEVEQTQRNDLAAALDRETTASAVQRRFLTQLGHEFGDPIRQLIASVDRLVALDGRLPPEEVAATRQVAQLLEERLHEVLGLTAGNNPDSIGSEQDLNEYLDGIAELLRPVAARRGLAIHAEAPAERVMLDTGLLTPVLVNLAANAIAATHQGMVRLSAQVTENDGTSWTVADSGSGLPAAVAAAFASAEYHDGTAPGMSGLGLGLTLVLANLQALGGRLRVVSTSSTGTELQITLPPCRQTGVWRRVRTSSVNQP